MKTPTGSVRRLHAVDDRQIDELADVLIDCVEGGASVSFMHPLSRDRALAFWRRVAQGVAAATCMLLPILALILIQAFFRWRAAARKGRAA